MNIYRSKYKFMKNSNNNDNRKFRLRNSLSAKTVRSTIMSCILFGLVAQIVALTFYAVSLTQKYISVADSVARQSAMSVKHGADSISFSNEVMDIYSSLPESAVKNVGTEEYREHFKGIDMSKGSTYDVLIHMLKGALEYNDVYDVYVAMYDRNTNRIVYIADPDEDMEDRMMPGDWEPVNRKGMLRFLEGDGEDVLYDIENTDKYGLLCTVGVPLMDEKGQTCAFTLVDISIKSIVVGMAEFSLRLTIALTIVTILLAYFQLKHFRKKLIAPINSIAEASQEFVKDKNTEGIYKEHFSGLDIKTGDEIENLSKTMSEMERDLYTYEKDLLRITAENERISTELSLASQIQNAMLPHIFPPFPDRSEFDIYAMMEPAREIGGDFYDFFMTDPDHLCIVMADVSGKGIPAALFMMISKTIIQSCAMLGSSAEDILQKTNKALCSNNHADMFVTAWVGILQISTGMLTAANAGHEYPVIKRSDGKFEIYKDKHGFVIGGMDNTHYNEYTLQLRCGDRMFLYTDGVTEAADSENNMFGTERMLESLNDSCDDSLEMLLNDLRTDVNSFVGDAEQFDDMTMLCFEYKKE